MRNRHPRGRNRRFRAVCFRAFQGAPRIIKTEPQDLGRRLAAVLMESSFAMHEYLHAELVDCVHRLTDTELQSLCQQGGWFFLRGEMARPVVDIDIGDPACGDAHGRVLHLATAPFERVVELARPREAGRPFPIRREDLLVLVLQDADEITSRLLEGLDRVRSFKQHLIDLKLPVRVDLDEPM